jgi:hypothetical protein
MKIFFETNKKIVKNLLMEIEMEIFFRIQTWFQNFQRILLINFEFL